MERRIGAEHHGVPAKSAEMHLHPRAIGRYLARYRWPLLFVSPFFILFGIFSIYPFLFSLWLSVVDYKTPTDQVFVGLDNFKLGLTDQRFWGSFGNSIAIFFMYAPLMAFMSAGIAVILNEGFVRFQGLWRAIIFMPFITSMVAAGYTFKLLLNKDYGVVNGVLHAVGLGPIPWLDDVWWARASVSMLIIWANLGFNTLIMLAGLQTISPEIVEAAQVDGASRLQAFGRITLPLLRPQIVFSITMSVLGTFSLFTEPFILTAGGPFASTESPATAIFKAMFTDFRFGYAAALGLMFMVIVIVVTLVQLRITSRGEVAL